MTNGPITRDNGPITRDKLLKALNKGQVYKTLDMEGKIMIENFVL